MRRKSRYIHELPDWPKFHWDEEKLSKSLASVRHHQGRLIGHMEALGFPLQQEAVLQTLTEDVVKSSDIEGEKLDAGQVRSSIARRLGIQMRFARTRTRYFLDRERPGGGRRGASSQRQKQAESPKR